MRESEFQIICAIVQISILYQFTTLVWWNSTLADKNDHTSYFNFFKSFNYASFVAYNISLNVTFWLKQDAFRLVFYEMQNMEFYDQRKNKRTVFWVAMFLINSQVILFRICDT